MPTHDGKKFGIRTSNRWDGKIRGKGRLICVNHCHKPCNGDENLLRVPTVGAGNAASQERTCLKLVDEWSQWSNILSQVFHTTACTLIKKDLDIDLTLIACTHHAGSCHVCIFGATFGASIGPKVRLFERFQQKWSLLDCGQFQIPSIWGNKGLMEQTDLVLPQSHRDQEPQGWSWQSHASLLVLHRGKTRRCCQHLKPSSQALHQVDDQSHLHDEAVPLLYPSFLH